LLVVIILDAKPTFGPAQQCVYHACHWNAQRLYHFVLVDLAGENPERRNTYDADNAYLNRGPEVFMLVEFNSGLPQC
jgi:hypothetical protein